MNILIRQLGGQPQKALEYYNQALPIRREVKDLSGEARTLSNIGAVYDKTGQPQKALEYYNQALPIRREVKDLSGEAITLSNIADVEHKGGNEEVALANIQKAITIEEQIRTAIAAQELRTSYFATVQNSYKFVNYLRTICPKSNTVTSPFLGYSIFKSDMLPSKSGFQSFLLQIMANRSAKSLHFGGKLRR